MRCSKKPFAPPICYSSHGLLIMKVDSNTIEYLVEILKVMKMISMPCYEYFITYILKWTLNKCGNIYTRKNLVLFNYSNSLDF